MGAKFIAHYNLFCIPPFPTPLPGNTKINKSKTGEAKYFAKHWGIVSCLSHDFEEVG